MRVSQLFGATRRSAPTDELVSHQLLLRAGFVQQLATGIFSYLPVGWRTEQKIRRIIREEMDAIGGQELRMPVVQPGEIWQRSGRWGSIDEVLLRFQDRRGRDMVLALSHEEVVADLTAANVSSYRDLPRIVYQLQTKFRDEPRSRGGLVRTREFTMKDSYSLDRDQAGLERAYIAHFHAYFKIAARAGIPVVAVLSDVGVMGGHLAHEFTYLTESGEDTLVFCDNCGYAANQEVAEAALPEPEAEPERELDEVETPGAETVAQLSGFLEVDPSRIAKTIAYMAEMERGQAPRLVLALVPGDAEVNLAMLRDATDAVDLRPATAEEVEAAGGVPGYMSPRGLAAGAAVVVADELIARRRNLVTGANRKGWHLRNFNLVRDSRVDAVIRLAATSAGQPCGNCGEPLRIRRGIEYGNIFQLGTKYSLALGALYNDEEGQQLPVVMGSYGIGVGRLLACIAEEHHDERGLTLPIGVAPFEVALISVGNDQAVRDLGEATYRKMTEAGIEVLFDDRDASPGVKFADADLRGIPLRVTVSPRSLTADGVELKRRSGEPRIVAASATVAEVHDELRGLRAQELDWAKSQLEPVEALAARTFSKAS
ncbi:MAG TPA: proline--tRNA ligase [Candidatus Saccharimonadales bacterium]|nr:proline--tRNA ligase [Candidatus Saccharimonadales bacterium]